MATLSAEWSALCVDNSGPTLQFRFAVVLRDEGSFYALYVGLSRSQTLSALFILLLIKPPIESSHTACLQ